MSLKKVHVLFAVSAGALALFCGVQAAGQFLDERSPLMALATVTAVCATVALARYERAFLRRCREAGIR